VYGVCCRLSSNPTGYKFIRIMIRKYKHVIWDWNGTLWNDSWLCFELTNAMLAERSMPAMSQELYQSIMRFPIRDYYSDLGFDYGIESYEDLATEFIEEYESRRFECKLQPESEHVLKQVKGDGIGQSVLSAYKHDTLLQAINYFGLPDYFSDIIGLDDIYADSKVDNAIAYISRIGLDKGDVLFVGDTVHDFEVAQAIGTDCVLVESGHNSRSRLVECGVPVFSTLGELI